MANTSSHTTMLREDWNAFHQKLVLLENDANRLGLIWTRSALIDAKDVALKEALELLTDETVTGESK